MRRLLLFFFLAVSLASAQTSIVFTWTNTSTLPLCSSTVTSSCLVSQTLMDTTGIATIVSATISPSATTYTLTPLPAAGTRTYSLVLNGKDQSGASVSSAAATTTVVVPFVIGAPSNLTGKPQ